MIRIASYKVRKLGIVSTLLPGLSHKVVEKITATGEHPFYVQGKGFVPARRLAVGNAIVTRAGPGLVVQSVTSHRRAKRYTVHNFVVEDDHTYFVGRTNGGTWVHNIECLDIANGLLHQNGGIGEIIHVQHPNAQMILLVEDQGVPQYFQHFAYGHNGIMYDPLLNHPHGIPFTEWTQLFDGAHKFSIYDTVSQADVSFLGHFGKP